jgi:hypothetical protein
METWRRGQDMETCRHRPRDMETLRNGDMETRRHGDIKRKTEAQAIFLNPFTVCSLYKWKFGVCQFVDEETNRSNLFANGLSGLIRLAHLWMRTHI